MEMPLPDMEIRCRYMEVMLPYVEIFPDMEVVSN